MKRIGALLLGLIVVSCIEPGTDRHEENYETFVPVKLLTRMNPEGFTLRYVGRIGSESDSLYYFGNISQIRVRNGLIYVMDLQFQSLTVYDPSTHTFIGRHYFIDGDGPGEVRDPIFFAFDKEDHVFVSSNRTRHIHVFTHNYEYMARLTQNTTHTLYTVGGKVHAINNIQYSSDSPLVKILGSDGNMLGSYGTQHPVFRDHYSKQRLQGVHHVFLTIDDDSIYLVYSLPFEVFELSANDRKTVSKYAFNPGYIGGTVQDPLGVLRYNTGRIVGADRYGKDKILIFATYLRAIKDFMDRSHYLYLLDIEAETYLEISLDDLGLTNLPGYTRTAVSDGRLYIAVIEPYPAIEIFEFDSRDVAEGGIP